MSKQISTIDVSYLIIDWSIGGLVFLFFFFSGIVNHNPNSWGQTSLWVQILAIGSSLILKYLQKKSGSLFYFLDFVGLNIRSKPVNLFERMNTAMRPNFKTWYLVDLERSVPNVCEKRRVELGMDCNSFFQVTMRSLERAPAFGDYPSELSYLPNLCNTKLYHQIQPVQ